MTSKRDIEFYSALLELIENKCSLSKFIKIVKTEDDLYVWIIDNHGYSRTIVSKKKFKTKFDALKEAFDQFTKLNTAIFSDARVIVSTGLITSYRWHLIEDNIVSSKKFYHKHNAVKDFWRYLVLSLNKVLKDSQTESSASSEDTCD